MEDIEHIDMFSTLCHPYTKRLFKACGAKYSEYIPEKSGYGGTVGGCPYEELCPDCVDAVSYTHLDVYKRQVILMATLLSAGCTAGSTQGVTETAVQAESAVEENTERCV